MARELPKPQSGIKESRSHPSHEEIARRAYEIFLERGCPEGRDMEHWLEAERQLSSGISQASAAAGATMSRAPRAGVRRHANGR